MNTIKTLKILLVLVVWSCTQSLYAQTDINQLISKLSQSKDAFEKIELCEKIGFAYQQKKAYTKAIEYYQQGLNLQKKQQRNVAAETMFLKSIGTCQIALNELNNAENTYNQIYELQKKANDKEAEVNTLHKLAEIAEAQNNNKKALDYTLACLQINEQLGDKYAIASTHNNLGFLYRQLDNQPKSVAHFNDALNIYTNMSNNNPKDQATIFTNMGVTYSYLRKFDEANEAYGKALKIAEQENNTLEKANLNNYMAANYYVSGKTGLAINASQKAINLAQNQPNNEGVLEASYKILSEIYQREKNFAEYQRYNKLYQDTKEAQAQKELAKQQELLEGQIAVEKQENEFKQLLAEKENQNLALKQAQLEKQKKEQELALLKQNQELKESEFRNQQLEKDRIQQMLQLTQQQALNDKKNQEIALLQKEQELKNLKIQQQEVENKEKQKALALKDAEAKLKDQKLNEATEREKTNRLITILGAGIAVLAVTGLVYTFVTNRKLRKQKFAIEEQSQEIAQQNEELHQNQEEILAQRDFITQQNSELSHQNEQIGQSINAALTIQQAILPYKERMQEVLEDHFVLFRPKDVVSGDFYWLKYIDNKVFVAAVDCTGHGVPGAFMSLIGNTLLDKIITVYRLDKPSMILEMLHQEVGTLLKQESTQNRDGMDVCFCILEKLPENKTKVIFSGAKRPLYYIEAGDNQVFSLKGDRKSIGGEQHEEQVFTDQEVTLSKDSTIYLSSDGYIDQNNKERSKIGEAKLKYTLSSTAFKSMEEQKKALEHLLDQHQIGTKQRDDILIIGIKV